MRILVAFLVSLSGCGWYYLKPDTNELATGAQAPAFSLPAANRAEGTVVSLAELRRAGDVVLVFYRGHW